MAIRFHCPACAAKQKAADYLAGRDLKCYRCNKLFTVPRASEGLAEPLPGPVQGSLSEFELTSSADVWPLAG
ncbi:MAG: hypothetical protein K2R98_04780 [Gemmataceae bacterium]|nr:hypothetical protein [Gemmataceae bacterium]